MNDIQRYKIEIFAPAEHVDDLREALNQAGGCKLGNYDNCMTTTEVTGYWRPLEGSNPHEGTINELHKGPEVKIETICNAEYLEQAVSAVKQAHPYEEPLINIIPLHSL